MTRLDSEISGGREAIDQSINTLRCATEELERFAKRYDDATNPTDKVNILSLVVNYATSFILTNMRLDICVLRASGIARNAGIQ